MEQNQMEQNQIDGGVQDRGPQNLKEARLILVGLAEGITGAEVDELGEDYIAGWLDGLEVGIQILESLENTNSR